MIYGLVAALGWGSADLGAAVVGRRIGSFTTVVVAQVAGLAAICLVLLAVRPAWSGTVVDVALLAMNGVIVAAAYVLHYRALELGPIALVSPLSAAYAFVPIALAVGILGERPSAPAVVGAVLTVAGVVLTSVDPRQLSRVEGVSPSGIRYAFASMILFGVAAFVLGTVSRSAGWLPTVVMGRGFTVVMLLATTGARRSVVLSGGSRGLTIGMAVGVADVVGVAAFSRGAELGLVSVVSAVSATFPLIPLAGGITMFRERPAVSQSIGVAFVVGGLVLIGLGS